MAEGAIVRRVDELLERLGLPRDVIDEPLHVPGAFADLAAGFDVRAFEERAFGDGRLAPGRHDLPAASGGVYYQGETSYHAWFDDEREAVRERAPASFAATTRLPLPRWALDVQQQLLVRLYQPGRFGWSTELFYSRERAASMGAHADNDDVFTVQLAGTRTWTIAPRSLEAIDALLAEGAVVRDGPESAWHFVPERRRPLTTGRRFTLAPGDLLVTPAFALHHVVGDGDDDGRSLAFNVSVCREEVWEAHRAASAPEG